MAKRRFHWDPVNDCVTHETDGAGNTLVTYTHEPGPFGPLISEERGGTTYTHHYDALGSTTFLTDDAGNVTDTFAYDAWGNPVARTGTTPTPYTWCGRWGYQVGTATTGGYYVRARSYQPAVVRWSTIDPIDVIYRLSLYTYSLNKHAILIDPTGLAPCCTVSDFKVDEGKCDIYFLTTADWVIGKRLATTATFSKQSPNKCSCCEFRQYHTANSYRKRLRKYDPQTRTYIPDGDWLDPYSPSPGIWIEDGAHGHAPRPYGHRDQPNTDNDKYSNPRRNTGCSYKALDIPGVAIGKEGVKSLLTTNRFFEVCISDVFLLQIIDTCNDGDVKTSQQVAVKCSMLVRGGDKPAIATRFVTRDLDSELCSGAFPRDDDQIM
jgi:RHS repeat-associated protein